MDAELGIYKRQGLLSHLHTIRKRIYTRVADLDAAVCTDKEPIPFDQRSSYPCRKITKSQTWGKAFTCAWFHFKGKIPEAAKLQHIVLIIDIDGEGLYVNNNNEPIGAITSRLSFVERLQSTKGKTVIEFSQCFEGSGDIDLWLEGGFNGKLVLPFGKSHFRKAFVAICRDDIKDFYYDYLTLSYALDASEDAVKQKEISKALKSAYSALRSYSIADVKNAAKLLNSVLAKMNTTEKLTFTAIGHSHLDLAWLWPIRETKRKAVRTFTNALNNIEKYSEYIYGASQPQQFDWVKQDYPSVFARIKEAVREGKIELQGGMWTEPDTNLPSGEALIRQIYYGKKFFLEEFNQDMKICWLPDVFGYSANLPQILKKTGMEYFMTIKLSWNEHNNFPYRTFNWIGIDNSSVLVHMPPEGTYNSGATPLNVRRAKDNFTEKAVIDNGLLVYGAGDGGGGPGEIHIELIKRQRNLEGFPSVRFGKAIDFFEKLKLSSHKLNSYQGELYLEKHQGTYTTQARNKQFNRKIEFLLHDVEMLAAYAYLKGYEYPHMQLERIWKEALLYQFHDILPGSGIGRIYEESINRYGKMTAELEDEKRDILSFLSEGEGKTYINTSSYPREEYIKAEGKWYLAKAEAYSSSPMVPVTQDLCLKYGADYIENEFIKAVFSPKGYLISLFDKTNNVETCGEYLNKLILYTDKWKFFNAWDIDINYPRKRKKLLRLSKTETFLDGPKVIRRNTYLHNKTTLTQEVSLTSGKQLLEFDTTCDYHETFKMLRADFAPVIFSNKVKCDIQFGSYDRSTKEDTLVEKAQFEICAHKWVDLSKEDYGISLLNDCKYGHRVKAGIISLNLLRSPIYPDPAADRGIHNFRYAWYPHKGNFTEGDTIKEGYHFNMAPIVWDNYIPFDKLVSTDQKNIIVETIKKAEKEESILLRLYEGFGVTTKVNIDVSFGYVDATECDMLENALGKIDLYDLTFAPFEVKTILLKGKAETSNP